MSYEVIRHAATNSKSDGIVVFMKALHDCAVYFKSPDGSRQWIFNLPANASSARGGDVATALRAMLSKKNLKASPSEINKAASAVISGSSVTHSDIIDVADFDDDYLEHHGILGMKWGVRRYQNDDGSLTDAGRKRYTKLKTKFDEKMTYATNKRKDVNNYVKSGHKTLSDLTAISYSLDQADKKQKQAEKIATKIEKQTGKKVEITNIDKKAYDQVMKYYSKKAVKEIATDKMLSYLSTFIGGTIGGIAVHNITLNKGINLTSKYKINENTKSKAVSSKEKREFEKAFKDFVKNPSNQAAMAMRVSNINQQMAFQNSQRIFQEQVMQTQINQMLADQTFLHTVVIPQAMMF